MNSALIDKLMMLPVLLPLLTGALLVLQREQHHDRKWWLNLGSTLVLLVVALALVWLTDAQSSPWPQGIGVYLAANWAAPFGIVLVVDRLAALLLLLTAVMAVMALLFASARWSRLGVHFHSLFQFLLMGINGAFLTGDLFNLFVFFELMLAASYGLVLHGSGVTRLRAGMQYIVVNLVASAFFLIGVALIYANTGTLNMADLARLLPQLAGDKLSLLEVGIAILAVAFLVKSAAWPLNFWLPTTYAAASPPVAAMLVVMTKVGVYVIYRLWLMWFSADAAGGLGAELLLWGGMATLLFGAIGMLASQDMGHMGGYSAVISSGTLLAALGFGQPGLVTAALFYLLSSTLALGAFLLLAELVERSRNQTDLVLALSLEAFMVEDSPRDPVGVSIPAAMAFLGLGFAACALVLTGMPPLSGFVAKFVLFDNLLAAPGAAPGTEHWLLLVLVILSGLAATIAMMRFGVRAFWAADRGSLPALRPLEAAPVAALVMGCVLMTVQAGPIMAYLERTTETLYQPERYIERILSVPAKPGPTTEDVR
ncbi:monovalent cation/H+ antiporter subunit D [Zobellella denitrificans]